MKLIKYLIASAVLLILQTAYASPIPNVAGIYEDGEDGSLYSIQQSGTAIFMTATNTIPLSELEDWLGGPLPAGFTGPFIEVGSAQGTVDESGNATYNGTSEVRDANGLLVVKESFTGSGVFANNQFSYSDTSNEIWYNADGSVFTTLIDSYAGVDTRIQEFTSAEVAAVVGEALIQSSVKQTTTMISKRIASIIKPAHFMRKPHTQTSSSERFDVANALAIEGMFASTQFNEAKDELQFNSGQIGLSAGDSGQTRGIWANIASTDLEDDSLVSAADGSVTTVIFGYDQKLNDKLLVGLAMSIEDIHLDNYLSNGNLSSDGYTFSPYVSYNIDETMAVYAIAGYGWIDYEQDKFNKLAKADIDATRSFVEVNFMAFQNFDKILLNERIGYLYTHESQDSYTEKYSDGSPSTRIKSNSITFSQLKANIEVAYAGEELEPYFDIGYYYDTDYEKISGFKTDRDGGDFTLGMRFFLTDQLTGDISATQNFARDYLEETTFSGNLRYSF